MKTHIYLNNNSIFEDVEYVLHQLLLASIDNVVAVRVYRKDTGEELVTFGTNTRTVTIDPSKSPTKVACRQFIEHGGATIALHMGINNIAWMHNNLDCNIVRTWENTIDTYLLACLNAPFTDATSECSIKSLYNFYYNGTLDVPEVMKLARITTSILKSSNMNMLLPIISREQKIAEALTLTVSRGVRLDEAYVTDFLYELRKHKIAPIRKDLEQKYSLTGEVWHDLILNLLKREEHKNGKKYDYLLNKKNHVSTSLEALEHLEQQGSQIAADIRPYQEYVSYDNTLSPLLKSAKNTGRVHYYLNTLATVTHRMTVTNQCLHNIPTELRDAFIADEGYTLVSVDYVTIEPRIAALIGQCSEVLSIFQQGCDIYFSMAYFLYPNSSDEELLEIRKKVKTATLLCLYGGGIDALTSKLAVDKATATRFMEIVHYFFKGYFDWVKVVCDSPKYTTSLNAVSMWSKTYKLNSNNRRMQILNYPIQGSAREIFCDAIIRLHEQGLSEYITLPMHDELIFNLPKAEVEPLIYDIMRTMTDELYLSNDLHVRFEVKATVLGDTWSKHGNQDTYGFDYNAQNGGVPSRGNTSYQLAA